VGEVISHFSAKEIKGEIVVLIKSRDKEGKSEEDLEEN
jgi:hypothetical protein